MHLPPKRVEYRVDYLGVGLLAVAATGSGLLLIPLMLGSTVTTLAAGQVTTRTGRYKLLPVIGGAVMTVGLFLLAHLGHIPTVGESMEYEGRRYRIGEMAGHRISRVVVEDIVPPPTPVGETDSTEATQ